MKKILIIRMSSIGDIVLSTSFLQSVKTKFPNHKTVMMQMRMKSMKTMSIMKMMWTMKHILEMKMFELSMGTC